MKEIENDARLLKAARLFCIKDAQPVCMAPWAFRLARQNIIFATDAVTMFIGRDPTGKNYPRKPKQIGYDDPIQTLPDWQRIVTRMPDKRRADAPVSVNPKYHARIMRAAAILGVDEIQISLGRQADELTYTIGPFAVAMVMPMRGAINPPPLPAWVRELVKP
jgi:hypothetical protein